ncbi:MAG: hypothetical protein OXC62_15535 [Aestuariivita sp.]|nr:hypothetical protein [Aestuariivita sp.]
MATNNVSSEPKKSDDDDIQDLSISPNVTSQDQSIQELEKELTAEKDARREERFFCIVICIIFFDVVCFTVMPNFGGPFAILVLELLILIPLARRMGMEEIAEILNSVITRLAGKGKD